MNKITNDLVGDYTEEMVNCDNSYPLFQNLRYHSITSKTQAFNFVSHGSLDPLLNENQHAISIIHLKEIIQKFREFPPHFKSRDVISQNFEVFRSSILENVGIVYNEDMSVARALEILEWRYQNLHDNLFSVMKEFVRANIELRLKTNSLSGSSINFLLFSLLNLENKLSSHNDSGIEFENCC